MLRRLGFESYVCQLCVNLIACYFSNIFLSRATPRFFRKFLGSHPEIA